MNPINSDTHEIKIQVRMGGVGTHDVNPPDDAGEWHLHNINSNVGTNNLPLLVLTWAKEK